MDKFTLLESHRLFERVHYKREKVRFVCFNDCQPLKTFTVSTTEGRHVAFKAKTTWSTFKLPSFQNFFCPLFSFCFQWRNIIKHVFISFWTGPYKEVVWSLYLCCLFLASVVARSLLTTMFHFVARLSPLRGDCHPALCQAWSWHAHTHTHTHTHTHIHTHTHTHVSFSLSPIFKKKKVLLLCFPHVILLRNPFLRADLKHVVARDLDRYISPINICSPGLLHSFQKATAYTPTHTYIHTHTYAAVHPWLTIKDSWFWAVSGQLDSHGESPNYRRLAHRQTLREHIYGQTLNAICQSL